MKKAGRLTEGSMNQEPPDMPRPTRDMLSTPPAITMSSAPWAILAAPKLMASRPEAQKREICMPGARVE
ncbi:hypothetical protein D9M70_593950 [compost metagenome]